MKIKRITSLDLAEITEIEKVCFSDCWNEHMLCRELELPQALYFAAEHKGKIVGYLGGHLICGQLDITRVAVLPLFRRKGIAAALFKEAAEHCERITLEVRESNAAAIALYKKIGFKEDCVRKNYYSAPIENAVLMSSDRTRQ